MYEFLPVIPLVVLVYLLGHYRVLSLLWNTLIDWAPRNTQPRTFSRFIHEATCLFLLCCMFIGRPRRTFLAIKNHWHREC